MPDNGPSALVRSLLLGLAAGARSTLGLFGPVAAGAVRPPGSPGAATAARAGGALGILGELVGDKLPAAPDRTAGIGTLVRALAGAAGGFQLRGTGGSGPLPGWAAAAAGAAGGAAGTWAGYGWRRLVASRGLPDWPAALAEDAVALTLAAVATGVVPGGRSHTGRGATGTA
jgi:uncharacterized membrane protein